MCIYLVNTLGFRRWRKAGDKQSLYGLQHGRLHLQVPTAMWMNMGYWKNATATTTMSGACRDLLKAVLAEAGFSSEIEQAEIEQGTRRTKCLIDIGFGCGDQTIYLMSNEPVRPCDTDWWDDRSNCAKFDHYIGITKDVVQAQYASDRIEELKISGKMASHSSEEEPTPNISLFPEDAAKPLAWNEQLQTCIQNATDNSQDCWMLALDTAYHFSPSRWPVINHFHAVYNASFMAFDLCRSPTATTTQKIMLRILTALMGAPWANFVTPQEYRKRLIQAGYQADAITITDISEDVFTPLATFLGEQDKRLKTLGLSIGSFSVAKTMFGWWGRSGVVRGVIIVARK
ncbi:hypothetical protein EJ02DRAFT_445388 [Clathrospora elynae]|uniref:S-adenosyl-L-methionine-dependent methyltransferase n=1 Tax=Clathrospora elynae TaxID=706981 RepID=A0A6A5SLQ9_9PLEO|nr:hypothetical protein EJ02DRAFT_445388 [Clathrospora elynae]